MSRRNWIAVASAEHVALGRKQGFMQVCHGKAPPLRRLRAGFGGGNSVYRTRFVRFSRMFERYLAII